MVNLNDSQSKLACATDLREIRRRTLTGLRKIPRFSTAGKPTQRVAPTDITTSPYARRKARTCSAGMDFLRHPKQA